MSANTLTRIRRMVSYRLNTPDVIHETVDGEALIIHTPSGVYFSLQGSAEHVWNAVLAGYSPTDVAACYPDDPGISAAEALAAIERFVEELVQEQLLVANEHPSRSDTLPPAPHPFSAPAIQKFTDMQELLLVDPIHEVDPEAGWPQRRSAE
jgi:hypothetical protein